MLFYTKLDEYSRALKPYSEKPLSLEKILSPFSWIIKDERLDHFWLCGHFMEALKEDYQDKFLIDPVDVLVCAQNLGYEPAGDLLKKIQKNIKEVFHLTIFSKTSWISSE